MALFNMGGERTSEDDQAFWLGLLLLISIAFILALILVFVPSAPGWFNVPKSHESTTQFLFGAVVGGGITVGFRQIEASRTYKRQQADRARERRDVQREAMSAFYKSFVDVHLACKKVRRTLRANENGGQCPRSVFERLMGELQDVQLNLESLKGEAQIHKVLFGIDQTLESTIGTAEKYLGRVLKQYENLNNANNVPKSDLISLDNKVVEFIQHNRPSNSPSQLEYFGPVQKVRELLLSRIQKLTPRE